MVLIHGFGGAGAVFLRMAPILQKNFDLVIVDLLGMGASGRPVFAET